MIQINTTGPRPSRRRLALDRWPLSTYRFAMFTIEHQFDATVITLIDEGSQPLAQDVIVEAYEDCVVIEQVGEGTDIPLRLTLSLRQVQDLAAALNLPEGSYRRK